MWCPMSGGFLRDQKANFRRKRWFPPVACFSRNERRWHVDLGGARGCVTCRIVPIDRNQPAAERLTCIANRRRADVMKTLLGFTPKRRHPGGCTAVGGRFPADRRCSVRTRLRGPSNRRTTFHPPLSAAATSAAAGQDSCADRALALLLQGMSSRIDGDDRTSPGFDERRVHAEFDCRNAGCKSSWAIDIAHGNAPLAKAKKPVKAADRNARAERSRTSAMP